ncbi:hypothetical protein H696_00307 [Fonticula alba]|uniref:Serine aminopeptidase S33 domain-containing protein n=1 Tax=Fonticula alba TaxID=691883 RepID=A0A058ZED1_FONAL|nr:hypothetical protein H696_00307 [Fonticula alba]KCV72729.1 hypothetical protein H696_00307 [Fonticula alba]|eukprot:XP_009492430.1 hypothetical protein H696_00307 [Fonticula alba]
MPLAAILFAFELILYAVTAALVIALTIISAVGLLASLLIKPPHYAHRKPHQGLAPKGQPPFDEDAWLPYEGTPKSDFGLDFVEVEFPATPLVPESRQGPVRIGNDIFPVIERYDASGSPVQTNQASFTLGKTPVSKMPGRRVRTEVVPTLRGWLIKGRQGVWPDQRGVVCVHGGGRDRREFHRMLPFLHEAGYSVLLFDLREHGISDGTGRGLDWGREMVFDVDGAVNFVKSPLVGWDYVALAGTSNGAALAGLACGLEDGAMWRAVARPRPLIDALILDSTYTRPRDGMRAIMETALGEFPFPWIMSKITPWLIPLVVATCRSRLRLGQLHRKLRKLTSVGLVDVLPYTRPRPTLIIHGTADRRFPVLHAHDIFNAIPANHHRKSLLIIEGGRHAETFNVDSASYQRKFLQTLALMGGTKSR